MTCLEIQSLITPFIDKKLDLETVEKFLHHIHSCKDCKEELEVYYILLTGMQSLDEDKNLSSDFHKDFLHMLRDSEEQIVQSKIKFFRKRILYVVAVCVTVIFSGIGVREYVEYINPKVEPRESNFRIKNYYFRNKPNRMDHYMKEYEEELMIYRTMHQKTKERIQHDK